MRKYWQSNIKIDHCAHNIPIFEPKSIKFGKHVPAKYAFDCMSSDSCYFGFVNENKDIFLSDDHIWKCQNLNSHIFHTQCEIFCSNFQPFSGVSITFKCQKNECQNHTSFKNCTFQIRPIFLHTRSSIPHFYPLQQSLSG